MSIEHIAGYAIPWSDWRPLDDWWSESRLSLGPGLYRIRRVGRDDMDYIGQTGTTLRTRLVMLKGIYQDVMPYRAPHTAAPALWALRHQSGCQFEASIAPVAGTPAWRKGLEALAIGAYRAEYTRSPTANFGRMPVGYRASSGNSARLVRAGKRFRGVPTTGRDPSHHPSLAPRGPLGGDPQDGGWCGHRWSPWVIATEAGPRLPRDARGLYRLRDEGTSDLLYVGEGAVRACRPTWRKHAIVSGRRAPSSRMLVPCSARGSSMAHGRPTNGWSLKRTLSRRTCLRRIACPPGNSWARGRSRPCYDLTIPTLCARRRCHPQQRRGLTR